MPKNRIYIPTFISSVNYAPARVLPHIYFYNGVKACETYYVQGYSNGNTGSVISTPLEGFPYFDNYEGQDPTSGSRSLLFFNEPSVYGTTPTGSLYTNYWEDYINLIYNPRTRLINCEGIIPLANYFKMELNDIVEWRGNYYHLRAINDYNLKNGECKIQLLGPILEDVITNILPVLECGFSFTQSIATPTTTTQAPTTTTTLPVTTTSTTAAPTTSTTTIQPYCVCQNVRFTNNHTRLAATLNYTPCGTTSSIQVFVARQSTLTVCLATAPGFSYPVSTDSFYTLLGSCTVPACQPTTTTAAPTTTTTLSPTTTTTAAPTTTTLSPTTTTTAAPSTTYRAVGCCDSASYYIGWTASNPALTGTIYNPVIGQCMTVVENVASQSVSFTITNANVYSYLYGYPPEDQCARCISLAPAPCPTTTAAPTTTTTLSPTTSTTLSPTTTTIPPPPVPLQRYTLTGTRTIANFVDFNEISRSIDTTGSSIANNFDFVAKSGSVNIIQNGALTITQVSASYPVFQTVNYQTTSQPGLVVIAGQLSTGEVDRFSSSNPSWTYSNCFVSQSQREIWDPLGKGSFVLGSACFATPTTTTTTLTPTTSTTLAPTTTTTTLVPTTTTTLAPTTTTTLAPTTTTTTIAGCSTWLAENTSSTFGAEVSYVPCGGAGYRNYFIATNSSASLCVQSGQIYVDLGAATLTDLTTPCTSSLQDCISYTITNSGGTQYTYGGKNCSNCALTLYNINAGQTVVRCFVSGTFTTSTPTFVTATAGANCNVSGSGCPI